ncbi:Glucokinase [Nocardioides aquaticus]|uniref:Glucokinase n=1 Tax=Nocardioides aquaticus TaxID=160826 RepID=A0ABX8EGD5_9ACTN|nr:ROK family glucokinase [Nocardioides aquaticus]QVT79147.1 Glucokinase [Nocardioides aquaticus]
MSLTCGIDVGGTKIAGAVVAEDGTVLEHRRVVSPAEDPEAIEDAIVGLVADLGSRHALTGVGVGAAGYIDSGRSVVMFAPNIAWRDRALREDLQERTHLPVVVENDANAAAWGEFAFGAGSAFDDLLLVTVGTGVGGGVVVDGELYRGASGVAAEIGHMRVVPDGLPCGCGRHGCLEQYASGRALLRQTREAAATDPGAAVLVAAAGGDAEAITGLAITAAARDGDPFALRCLAGLGRWLGEGIASICAVLDPGVVVIGGGVSEAGDLLLDPTRAAFADQVIGTGYRPLPQIVQATLGNDAGVIGAADLARR